MPDAWETAQQWIASARAQGHSEAALRKGLEEAGWGPAHIEQLLGSPGAPPPSFGTPPPPTYMSTAAPPTVKSNSGLLVGLLIGCACLIPAVAILAAILFPVFARARAKAEQASCLSNLKQLGLAEAMYATDYDNRLPSAGDWPQKLAPYHTNDTILLCPSDQRPDKQKSADKPTSYTMSDALGGVRQDDLANPQNLGVMFDGTQLYGLTPAGDYRHNNGLNLAYADGHCKWQSQEAFATVPLQPSPQSGTPSP